MSVEMVWEEPPPATTGKNQAILAELKKNPGRWALVNPAAASTSAAALWKKLGCEATHRRDETSEKVRYHVYARWPVTAFQMDVQPLAPGVRPNGYNGRPKDDKGLNRFLESRDKRGANPDGLHFPGDPK